ncbi:MAG: hypothetical protein ABI167_02725 [Nitrosospira sp.]
MTIAFTKRRIAMGLALTITVWLSFQADDQEQEGVIQLAHSSQRPDRAKTAATNGTAEEPVVPQQSPATLNWQALAGRMRLLQEQDNSSTDLFKPHDWYMVSKPAGVPPPPPKPVAPEAPFTYLGKLEDTPEGTKFFLTENNKVYSVGIGQNIENLWRLDAEDATTLNLTYLPLGLPQTLPKSGKPAASAEYGDQGGS